MVDELRKEVRIQRKANSPPAEVVSDVAKCRSPTWVVPVRRYQNSCHFRARHRFDPSKSRVSLCWCGIDGMGCMEEIDKNSRPSGFRQPINRLCNHTVEKVKIPWTATTSRQIDKLRAPQSNL